MDRLSDYDYELPPERIAQHPLEDRSASRLLWLHRDSGKVEHLRFRDLPEVLSLGDLIVRNNTRVSALRLFGERPGGGAVELLLLAEEARGQFLCLAKPASRLREGKEIAFPGGLTATVIQSLDEGRRRIRFEPVDGLVERLHELGQIPLPPYIHETLAEAARYQTTYAQKDGSSAAPTAGLHFTPELDAALRAGGIGIAEVTLDVGIDTFRPVRSDDLSEHKMHGETCEIPPETVEAIACATGRILGVGTTSVRTLETMATGSRQVRAGREVSTLFIRPGFRFQVVDGMLTNFHMPRTTMLMMCAALSSRESLFNAYAEAISQEYRFLSFGDAMMIV